MFPLQIIPINRFLGNGALFQLLSLRMAIMFLGRANYGTGVKDLEYNGLRT